jgi:hypothetical protein
VYTYTEKILKIKGFVAFMDKTMGAHYLADVLKNMDAICTQMATALQVG